MQIVDKSNRLIAVLYILISANGFLFISPFITSPKTVLITSNCPNDQICLLYGTAEISNRSKTFSSTYFQGLSCMFTSNTNTSSGNSILKILLFRTLLTLSGFKSNGVNVSLSLLVKCKPISSLFRLLFSSTTI